MNKEFRVYLGCYVLLPRQSEAVTRTIDGCPKCQEQLYYNFCPKCGSPKGPLVRTYDQEKLHNAEEILKESGTDSMFIIALNYTAESIVLIPQEDLHHGCGRFIDHQTYIPLSFLADSNNAIKQEKASFMKTFDHSLASIQQLIPNAKLEWGIVAFNDENY
jgi:hypothetical protein